PRVAGHVLRDAELRVVEHVVHLPAELQAAPAAAEREILEERKIPVVDPGHAEDVARLISVLSPCGPCEGARVEPAPGTVGRRIPVARGDVGYVAGPQTAPAVGPL